MLRQDIQKAMTDDDIMSIIPIPNSSVRKHERMQLIKLLKRDTDIARRGLKGYVGVKSFDGKLVIKTFPESM